MIRILNAELLGYSSDAQNILQGVGQFVARDFTRQDLLREIPTADVLIVRLGFRIDKEMIDEGKQLKAIVIASTGLDQIDPAYAKSKNIAVLSLHGETAFIRFC